MVEEARAALVPEREIREWDPIEMTVTKEMVEFFLIAINDRNEWYRNESPFGGPIAPPMFIGMLSIRASAKRMWGDFTGAIFTEPHRLLYMTEADYFEPVFVGETIEVRSKSLGISENRGREYARTETTVYGKDGVLRARLVSTSLLQYKKKGPDA